jgi:transposase InsO family protein
VLLRSIESGEYTAGLYRQVCERLHITQSMGRVGSALDNAPAESLFSTLEFECLRKHRFVTKADARRTIAVWIDGYNRHRRHSSIGMISPVEFELARTSASASKAA